METVPALAHQLIGLGHIAQRLRQFQHTEFRLDNLLLGGHRPHSIRAGEDSTGVVRWDFSTDILPTDFRGNPQQTARLWCPPKIDHGPVLVELHNNIGPFRNCFGFHFHPFQRKYFFSFRSLNLDLVLGLTDMDQLAIN